MLMDCTVPFGSGLSSSAAIEVSTIAAMATVAGEELDGKAIAPSAQKAEHEFAGVHCGIMDQYISACGKKDHAVLLDCKTLEREYIPVVLGDHDIVVINCKKPHNLVESKYNERRAETELALETLKKVVNITCLADLTPEEFARHSGCLTSLGGKISDRAKHVVEECARVNLATESMKKGDMAWFGSLLNESHFSLKDLYEVTGRELDSLTASAREHPACLGSRMTGAGFGGCTVSLVKKDGRADFEEYVLRKYREETGYTAEIYDAVLSDGITVQKLG